jgi:hypothetical protein
MSYGFVLSRTEEKVLLQLSTHCVCDLTPYTRKARKLQVITAALGCNLSAMSITFVSMNSVM